ncbi:MAG: hypothetical protein PHP69_04770 [Candidatus Omnitrophica bacterium]|nr:hypothetical protein [Candidatus Omnitrophota bacterium]
MQTKKFDKFKLSIIKIFKFTPSKNQTRDILRLTHEISARDKKSYSYILKLTQKRLAQKNYHNRDKFKIIRDFLITLRFPATSKDKKISSNEIFFNFLPDKIEKSHPKNKKFVPEKIYFEPEVADSAIIKNVKKLFPKIPTIEIPAVRDYIKNHPFNLEGLKRPVIFCIKENWDFFKPCPCTKDYMRCGYWVFNLGFGCPFDCSYCFLQEYTNFPGLTLPANIDDFFEKFDEFEKTLKNPIRIGTGEFCDSLALDHITKYSTKLVPYFKEKNVIFELKTKSANIGNLLKIPGSKNIVISWSLNPKKIARNEELKTASLKERLKAAKKLQNLGYSIAFHFDPIIYYNGWEKDYLKTVDMIYKYVKPDLAWISLGTLRCQRNIKTINEKRFNKSTIFYGELFLGKDKKLRYPENIRKDIYLKMKEFISRYDTQTPIYPCMETAEIWNALKIQPQDIIKNCM